jgi:hypothetical protein
MRDNLGWLAWLATVVVACPLNQWRVRRKGLDHRPWFVPSLWGLVGTLLIAMARPRGFAPAVGRRDVPRDGRETAGAR